MANQKPKKSGKKPSPKPENKQASAEVAEVKDEKATKTVKETTAVSSTCEKPMKGFFARKCDPNENIVTIFKSPKIWGALIGEVIGTMLITMFFLTVGVQPLYLIFGLVCVYIAVVGLSGAHLNPLITAGMMATRRVSAIRGILYILAQLLGAWIGLILINAFRLGSGTTLDLPMMTELTGEGFWAAALVELLGAGVIAFCFARALRFARKQPLAFALTVTSGITLAVIFGIVIAQNFFGTNNSFVFNPVIALMYQILPTAADGFGELAQAAGLALAAYIVFPILGGIIGFYISDIATRLSCGGYFCECDDEHCHGHCPKDKLEKA